MKVLAVLVFPLLMISCSNPNKNCLDSDMFGHCNHWEGQPISCKERTVLGLCKTDRSKTQPAQ